MKTEDKIYIIASQGEKDKRPDLHHEYSFTTPELAEVNRYEWSRCYPERTWTVETYLRSK